MSNKIETLAKIQEVGIVAVVRATSIEQAEKSRTLVSQAELPLLSLPLPFRMQINLSRL